ncbi:MAG: hypothetical protein AMXMBFR72_34420 [Betaproteobacteria bacterium]
MKFTGESWRVVSGLLDEALDLEPQARDAWLERIARTRPDIAPALRRLLAAHATSETADVLARRPALAVTGAPRVDDAGLAAGDRVGPYRLIREIGGGGMADVWLAERADGALARSVALKLPRVTRLRRDLAVRFARERDILARLEHANIARLYDAGVTRDGLPYLAMEYVEGQPITRYCDERRLDIRARLKLFVQVLEAVQYAHANLVIHRDLKPSNILVTADGQVRLLDFGIAKLLAEDDTARETQLTQLAGRALTPDYASPEQIKGEPLSIATDVYSLGVVLYELLAGARPYRLKLESAAQLEQAIVAVDPPKPSSVVSAAAARARCASVKQLARALTGDLDTIALKALAKQPALRYATMAEFADDLDRHLSGRVVRARPASWHVRARKFVARNKLAVGAAGGIVAALAIGTVLALWQASQAQRQAMRAVAVTGFLTNLFEANSLEPKDAVRRRHLTAGQLLEEGAQRIGSHFADDPELKAELQGVVGRLLHDLSLNEQALTLRRERLDALTHAQAPPGERARALRDIADTLAQRGDSADARDHLEAAIRLLERRNARDDAVLRWSLVSLLGYLNIESGDRAAGSEQVSRAAERLRELAPQSVEFAEALLRQGEVLSMANRTELSVPILREALALLDRQLGTRSLRVARHRYRVAHALMSQRRFSEAEAELKQALQTMADTAGAEHPSTAIAQLALGRALSIQGRTREARTLIATAVASLQSRNSDVDPLHVADALAFLAESLLDEGRISEAGTPLREAMRRYEGITNSAAVTVAQTIYARYLLDTGKYAEAQALLERARDTRAGLLGRDHPAVASLTNRIGLVHLAAGRLDDAEATFRAVHESQPVRENVFGSPRHLAALNLARLGIERGRFASALPEIARHAQTFDALPAGQRNLAAELAVRMLQARALIGAGHAGEARPHVERAEQIAAELYEHAPARIQLRTIAARLLAAEGKRAHARDELASARASLRTQPELGPHFERMIRAAERDVDARR